MSVTQMNRGGLLTDIDIHSVIAMEVQDLDEKGMCVNVVTDDGIKVGLFCERDVVEQLVYSLQQFVDKVAADLAEKVAAEKGGAA